MSCQGNCQTNTECHETNRTNNSNFIFIIVLYILLAIIIGSYIY